MYPSQKSIHQTTLEPMLVEPQVPATPSELRDFAKRLNRRCTCDMCTPRRYTSRWSCMLLLVPHVKIDLHKDMTTNQAFQNPAYSPLKLNHRLHLYNPMHLARTIEMYIAPDVYHLNNVQLVALGEFRQWMDSKDLTQNTRDIPGNILLPAAEMRQLWTWFNSLFFSGDLTCYKIRWNADRVQNWITGMNWKGHKAAAYTMPIIIPGIFQQYHIVMDPEPNENHVDGNDNTVMSFVEILLHEAVHAFLDTYACFACRTYREDVGAAAGHGRAFQAVSKAIENALHRWLDVDLDLGRLDYIAFWEKLAKKKLHPSVHDVEMFAFEDYGELEDGVRNTDICSGDADIDDDEFGSVEGEVHR